MILCLAGRYGPVLGEKVFPRGPSGAPLRQTEFPRVMRILKYRFGEANTDLGPPMVSSSS